MRDRYGEPVDDPARGPAVTYAPDHRCARGWLDRDGDHPRPCPHCRPWLAERRPPTVDELADARERSESYRSP